MSNGNDTATSWSFMQSAVCFMVIGCFIGVIFSWMYYPPATTDAGILAILNQLTGAVTALAVAIVGYYFGSSKSSQDKDDTAKMSTKAAVEAASTTAATLDKLVSGTGSGVKPAAPNDAPKGDHA